MALEVRCPNYYLKTRKFIVWLLRRVRVLCFHRTLPPWHGRAKVLGRRRKNHGLSEVFEIDFHGVMQCLFEEQVWKVRFPNKLHFPQGLIERKKTELHSRWSPGTKCLPPIVRDYDFGEQIPLAFPAGGQKG